MKKIVIFDLDGTLAVTKSAIEGRMAALLGELLDRFQVCVISGGKFEQFEKQLLSQLNLEPSKLSSLHIMPTCGTRYYRYSLANKKWEEIYAENFTTLESKKIINALELAMKEFSLDQDKLYGDQIEDRGSQVTLSALGQDAPADVKEAWDPTGEKKVKLRDYIAKLIPEFEVRTGGTTSIDITKLGIDKAYGMHKLMEILSINKNEMLFLGDRLKEGGNDYPVKEMGVESIEVSNWEDTAKEVETILANKD